jgi:uncharacterized membrane protein YczE
VTLAVLKKVLTMNSVALCAGFTRANCRFGLKISALAAALSLLTACAGVGTSVGISVPMGRAGGVGVSVGSFSMGASGQLPKNPEQKKEEEKK